jgi:hypothetical protein
VPRVLLLGARVALAEAEPKADPFAAPPLELSSSRPCHGGQVVVVAEPRRLWHQRQSAKRLRLRLQIKRRAGVLQLIYHVQGSPVL